MVFREGTMDDYEGIFVLYKTVAAEDGGIARTVREITEDYVRQNLSESLASGIVVVAENDGHIIGELHAWRMNIRIFEHVLSHLTIAVHPDFQNQKVGRRLFHLFLQKIEDEMPYIRRVELHTRAGNLRALALYQKLGFQIEGYLKDRDKMADGRFDDDVSLAWMNKNYKG
jgi:putative acetyltransferase